MHVEFPIVSFICCLLVLAPLPWHWRAGTVPTIAITFWMFLGNLINGVNAIVWADNTIIKIPVWCDITTKIQIGSNLALPAAILCLCIQLEQVSSTRQVQTSLTDKRRRQIWNSLFCFVLPVLQMALHYIVQGHRFDLVEDFGCRASIYNSVASIFLIWFPPLVLSLAAGIYSALALHHFWIRRVTFARHLQSKNSALTSGHYFRLMTMALVQIFWSLLITTLDMWFTMRSGLRPWTGWTDVHSNFGRIGQVPRLLIPDNTFRLTYALYWTIPISSFLFFAFFSFGKEAMTQYAACIRWFQRVVMRRPEKPSKTPLLPSYVARDHNIVKLHDLHTLPLGDTKTDGPSTPTTPTTTAVDSDFSCPSPKGRDAIDLDSLCPSYYGVESTTPHDGSFRNDFRRLAYEHRVVSPSSRPTSFPSFFSKSVSR